MEIIGSALKSYLDDVQELVYFHAHRNNESYEIISESTDVDMGVPQGSILGPILFILCMDSFSLLVRKYFSTTYTDDVTAFATSLNINITQKSKLMKH